MSQRLALLLCITFVACSPMKESNTRPSTTKGLCASARPGDNTIPTPLPPPPSVELSIKWDCAFPDEADKKGIDSAETSVQVLVGPDGTPLAVRILADPGYGFAEASSRCAFAHSFAPGHDANGTDVPSWTRPICVRYSRYDPADVGGDGDQE